MHEMVESQSNNHRLTQKTVLGIGFVVQGMRNVPLRAVSYFLKDGLLLDSSTIQLLKNSVNLPQAAKPIYGIVSDAFYIQGQHRIPYIAFGALLQAVSWISLATLSLTDIRVIFVYLLLCNLGSSITDVVHDAMVAELGKQFSSRSKEPSKSGELESFVWVASSVGGVLGNLIGGVSIDQFSPQSNFLFFGVLIAIHFLLTIGIRESSLNLPRNPNLGIKKQLSYLWSTPKKSEISYAVIWFAASYAVVPDISSTTFFYHTQHLKIKKSVSGLAKVFGQVAKLVWSIVYKRHLKSIPTRKIICDIQMMIAIMMILDALFVEGFFRKLGVSDSVYAVAFSGFFDMLVFFKILPFSVLMARLCPPGCEGSLMAFAMSAHAIATIVSGYWGVVVTSYLGVTENDFSKLSHAISIQAICTLLPLLWSSWIPDDSKSKRRRIRKELQ